MSEQLISSVTAVLLAIVGVALLATLVSKNAATSQVIGAGGNAFSGMLGSALSPVSGFGSYTGGGAGLPNLGN